MKILKSAVAVLLSVLVLLSLAACGKKDADTDPTDNSGSDTAVIGADTKTKTLEEAGLSLDKIFKANDIEALMKKYSCVTVKTESSDGCEVEMQILRFEDDIAVVSLERDANGAETVTGYIKGFDFVVENDRVKAYRDVEELDEKAEFDENDLLTEAFEDKKLAVLDTDSEDYILKSLSEDEKTGAERYFYIDRTTLELKKETFKNVLGNTVTTEVTYDGEPEAFAKKITDSFDGEMKTVKIVAKYVDDGEISESTVSLRLPADWEYVPAGDGRIDYYMDSDTYPGHGKDYTIYISNIFDDEDKGKK